MSSVSFYGYMPGRHVTGTCQADMLRVHARQTCHGNMPDRHVTGTCQADMQMEEKIAPKVYAMYMIYQSCILQQCLYYWEPDIWC